MSDKTGMGAAPAEFLKQITWESLQDIDAHRRIIFEAIVIKHYEGYIIKLSTRKLYDESGQVHYCIDETLRRRLETKLITKILAFEVA